MLSIHCKKCNQLISDSYLLCFLTNETNKFELTSKLETKDKILLKLIISNDNINEYACNQCLQIVCFISIHQNRLCFKRGTIYFKELIYGKDTKHEYDNKTEMCYFPLIQDEIHRTPDLSLIPANKFPTTDEIIRFNIGSLIRDLPNEDQIESYIACLVQNTICYLPINSSLVISMIISFIKKLNQNKKCVILSSQKALYELSSQLEWQTGLSIYHNQKNRSSREEKSQISYSDVFLFTIENFLKELQSESDVLIEDISCILIGESTLLMPQFEQLIHSHYSKTKNEYKPRLIGIIKSHIQEINQLTDLIEGRAYRPVTNESKQTAKFKFHEVESDTNKQLMNLLDQFIIYFVEYLTKNSNYSLKTDSETINTLIRNKILKERNIQSTQKRFSMANLVLIVLDSIEMINLIGVSKACSFLSNFLDNQIKHNKHNRIFNSREIYLMGNLLQNLGIFNGVSNKFIALFSLLKYNTNFKTIICVKNKETAKCLFDQINLDNELKKYRPRLANHQSKKIVDLFNSNDCQLLVLSYELDLVAERVILFDNMWMNPLVKCERCQFIVICSEGEQSTFDQLNQSKTDMFQSIDSLTINRVNQEHIAQLAKLINRTNDSETKLKQIQFSVKLYIIESEIKKLHTQMNKLETHHIRIESSKESFATESALFPDLVVFNLVFKSLHLVIDSDDEIEFKIKTIKNLLNGIDNCACHLFSHPEKAVLSIMATKMKLGNLATPFKFFHTESVHENNGCKVVVELEKKCIQIINNEYKIEIPFNSIDHIICCDDQINHLNVYIPCKRAPLFFKSEVDTQNESNELFFEDLTEKFRRICPKIEQNSWTFKLEFDASNRVEVFESFQNIKGNTFLFCSILNAKFTYLLDNLRADFIRNSFKLKYILEVFITQNDYLLSGKIDKQFSDRINSIDPHNLTRILEHLTMSLQSSCRFQSSIIALIDQIMEKEMRNKPVELHTAADPKIVLIRRATITPLRIIYHFPEPFSSNRVIRKYNPDKFIRLRFRDEDMLKLNSSQYNEMEEVYERINTLLKNGLKLFHLKFTFLAMSSSQLRDHGCWLSSPFHDQIDSNEIRQWMGDFNSIRCVGKYAARLGQSLSCSVGTFHTTMFNSIPDIKTNDLKYCFTDGIGKISMDKAKEICDIFLDIYEKEIYASTFQIRFAGFKGVLSAWPNLANKEIQFRPSMKKYDSGDNSLDVLNVAEYIPCFLNRQIIIILSALGISDSVFSNLQDIMLKRMSGMLINKVLAASFIKNYFRNVFAFASNSKMFNYALEPFFRDILKAIYRKHLQGLIDKSRIFVEKGRILMGCIDETGTLNEDEIFVQCDQVSIDDEFSFQIDSEASKNKYLILETKVAVAKNPCMHPGDIRVLKAVNKPELKHLVNCIVFPSKGERPITSMCSGSDLDGDLYWVTWDPNLIPDHMEQPMEYDAPPAKEKETRVEIEDIIEFFVKFIESDQLGRLANAHQAFADQGSVLSDTCKKIALAFSYAVDFPKTGYVAELPEVMKQQSISFPDFMQKKGKSYISKKIIGQMYRKCKSIFQQDQDKLNHDIIELNPSYLIDGYEAHLEEAKQIYSRYRAELKRVMTHFGCDQENELFVGVCVGGSVHDETHDLKKVSSWSLRKIWQFFRDLFFEPYEDVNNLPDVAYQKASAWYVASYSSNQRSRILSFPWIIEDVIQKFPNIQNYDMFSFSIIQNYLNLTEKKSSFTWFIEIIKLKEEVSKQIGHELVISDLFGLFILENINDFQFLIINNDSADMSSIKTKLERKFGKVSFSSDEMKCHLDTESTFSIRLSNSSLSRFLYLRQIVFKNNVLLPIFYSIIHFARLDPVFITLNISIDLFLEFCVNYFVQNQFISDISTDINFDDSKPDELYNWYELYDSLMVTNEQIKITGQTSQMLLNFYRENAFIENEYLFKSKFEPFATRLSSDLNESLKKHFFKIFNNLSKANNISTVWVIVDTEIEPNKRKHAIQHIERCCKSPCTYDTDSFLLLFTNLNSQLDTIKFRLYSGNKLLKHSSKECYSPILENTNQNSTNKCYEEYFKHAIQQLQKGSKYSKAKKHDVKFRFRLKFGNFYLTNISPVLLNSQGAVTLTNLKNDVKFNTYDFIPTDLNNNSSLSNLIVGLYPNRRRTVKTKFDKKQLFQSTYSAFNSNATTDTNQLHSIFNDNGFKSMVINSYTIYTDIKDSDTLKFKSYKFEYNSDLELIKVEKLPVKWLHIDIRDSNSKKDLSFCLESSKQEDENNFEIFKACPINNEIVLNEQYRHFSQTYIRELKAIKYSGDFSSWQSLLNLDDQTPNQDMFKKLVVSVSLEKTHSDNGSNGVFQSTSEKKLIEISTDIDFSTLSALEYAQLISLMWSISQGVSKII